jgi:predicted RNase H-like nuclease
VRVIGVDLAWSTGRTGLCLAHDGQVGASFSVESDQAVCDSIREWMVGDVLVAIDAPLSVINPTGRRPCENVLSSAYWREQAGPHPANLGLPAFRAGVRGAWLARTLGLSIDPGALAGRPRRAAIEVYPHPALVCLCDLPVTLKYKRHGHLERRRREFRALLGCLRSFAGREPALDVERGPRWKLLGQAVDDAGGHRALDMVEDELDAMVCAYVGLYHAQHAGRASLTVGDPRNGYIITPVCLKHDRLIRDAAAARGVPIS